MSQNGWIAVVVGVLIIGGGVWWFTSQKAPELSDDGTPVAADVNENNGVQQAPMPVPGSTVPEAIVSADTSTTVTYNGSSFSPAEVTIKKGDKVTFTSTAGNMWVASGPHPEHTGYDTSSRAAHCAAGYGGVAPFDQCVAGTSYTFTFGKVGTWPYHNHIKLGAFGKVIVTE